MKRTLFLIITIIFASRLIAFEYQNDTATTYGSDSEAIQKAKEFIERSETYRTKNPQTAVKYGLSALKISQEINNGELQYKSEFATGFAYYIQNDFQNALIHLNKALELSGLIDNRRGKAASLNRIGNTYQLMGQYQNALRNYDSAMVINRELQDNQEIARTLTNLGSVYRLYGNYELAINQHLEALSIYEGLQNNEGIAWSALNIARLFKMMKNYDKSIEYVNQSLNIYQKIEGEQEVSIGVTLCYKELGSIYYEMGITDKAIDYSQKVLDRNKNSNNKLGVANSLSTLGKIYYDIENYEKSEEFLIRAMKLKKSLNNQTDLAAVYRYLGKIYLNRGELTTARKYLNNSLDFALNQNLKEDIKESYLELSILYEKTNEDNKALAFYKQYTALKDSLNNQKINELELQYEFDKQQRKREFEEKQKDLEQDAKLQREKIFKWAFASGFLLMLILAYAIFNSYQRKKKTNVLLTKQKKEIEEQRDEIEAQRDFVTKQRDQIAHQNTIITDSIEYARRIQSALFPQQKFLDKVLGEYFIYMKPKNIVSGDFYWVAEKGNKVVITVSDCTGHGVPGAFMSMLGIAFLNEIVNKSNGLQANNILDQLRENIMDSLHQEYGSRGSKDGMDMALCIIDKETLKMEYAGAYNPVFIIRNNEIIELKADKMPIGIHAVKMEKNFTQQQYKLENQDTLYMFSDGYVDQFGGEKGMKFKQKPFKELLLKIADKPMDEQRSEIENTMKAWQGEETQLDDMMVMGIRF